LTVLLALTDGDDVNPANDEAMVSLSQPIPAPQLAWTTADYLIEAGATCRNEITLQGVAMPQADLRIFTDGFASGDVSALADGSFAAPLPLSNGRHQVRLQMLNVPNPIVSNPIYVDVNNNLLFDPSVTTFTDENGLTIHPVDWHGSGAQTPDKWLAHLQTGMTYTLRLAYWGQAAKPTIVFHFGSGESVLLTHVGNGIYTGEFELAETMRQATAGGNIPMGIAVTTGDVTVWSRGVAQPTAPGTVRDASTGQPLAGAAVTALTQVETAVGADADTYFETWPGVDFGQSNPQISDAAVGPGSEKGGYPYRWRLAGRPRADG
jgi:hypothetical protein